ncbi:hypothetical protein AVT10_14315 [Sphingomonas hankookensis]|jgi:hypothetical protein|uniref:Uncharacterized protein n=1 Tax=Sphingomonas hankookensis TaxID=563996 RepID=A0ABR5YCQ4_9SPHN|nr:hypothetical protein AVT10_14315 [Sphingomonas hankookensis]PZT94542.1 MAG: hypothetical protein DI625_07385 [Sphingomonas sp.]
MRRNGAQKRSERGRAGGFHLDRGVFSYLFSVSGFESQKSTRIVSDRSRTIVRSAAGCVAGGNDALGHLVRLDVVMVLHGAL